MSSMETRLRRQGWCLDTSEKIYGCRETEHAEHAEAAAEEETKENKPNVFLFIFLFKCLLPQLLSLFLFSMASHRIQKLQKNKNTNVTLRIWSSCGNQKILPSYPGVSCMLTWAFFLFI